MFLFWSVGKCGCWCRLLFLVVSVCVVLLLLDVVFPLWLFVVACLYRVSCVDSVYVMWCCMLFDILMLMSVLPSRCCWLCCVVVVLLCMCFMFCGVFVYIYMCLLLCMCDGCLLCLLLSVVDCCLLYVGICVGIVVKVVVYVSLCCPCF